MISSLYEFNGRYYAIDMDKFMEFISHNPNNEKDTNTVITQVFADTSLDEDDDNENIKEKSIGDFRAVSKEITETKTNNNVAFNNVRYDFIRILLNTIVSPYYSPEGAIIKVENDDDFNYLWSDNNWSVLIGENRHRDIPNIVFVFDFKKPIEIGRIGIGKAPEQWPYNQDLRNCEFYVGNRWNFKSAAEKTVTDGKRTVYWPGGGDLANYNTAYDEENDFNEDLKPFLTATDIPKETGIFWYDVPETVSKADRTGRYLKIRPTVGYRGNTPCEIAEIYVDAIVQEKTANVE